MRILVICNPASGRAGGHLLAAVLARLEAGGCEVVLRETGAAGDAEAFAAEIRGGTYERLAVAGGDGTVNEVVNGLAAVAEPPALAVIPAGTANVLAAEIGLPDRAEAVVDTILGGDARPIALGQVGGLRFVLMAGAGFDARVVAGVDGRLKAVLGKGAYLWSALRTLLTFGRPDYRVTVDGVAHRAASVIVTRGRYYAGRFMLAPDARLDAAEFQVCLFEHGGPIAILGYGLRLVSNRLHLGSAYRIVPGCRVEVLGPAGEPVQVDGDAAGTLPADIRILPAALRLCFPRQASSPGAP